MLRVPCILLTCAAFDALLEHYADRQVLIVKGPARSGRGFEVVSAPLKAEEVEYWEGK